MAPPPLDDLNGGSFRQRDLFPIPLFPEGLGSLARVGRAVRQRVHRKLHWVRWCNDGISTLNALAGRGRGVVEAPRNLPQQICMPQLAAAYRDMASVPLFFF